jgi:hypothetical protein
MKKLIITASAVLIAANKTAEAVESRLLLDYVSSAKSAGSMEAWGIALGN